MWGSRRSRRRSGGWVLTATLVVAAGALVGTGVVPTVARFTGQATVTGNAFTTRSCVTRSPFVVTGFEFGPVLSMVVFDSSSISSATNAVTDTAVKRTGSYALKLIKPSGGTTSVTKASTGTVLAERFYLYLDTLPSATVAQLATVGVAAGSAANLRYNASTNKLEMGFGADTAAAASSTATAATWYRIGVKVDLSANPRIAQWQIDGVTQTPASAAEAASTVTGTSWGSTTSADAYTVHIDDLVASRTGADYPFGAGHAVPLVANGSPLANHVGSSNFNETGGAAIDVNAYTHVDDLPMNTMTDYLQQASASTTSYLQLDLTDPVEWCFNGVEALVSYHAPNGGANSGRTSIFDGAQETVVQSGDMSTSGSLTYAWAMVVPASAPWTATAVTGLVARIGYSADVHPGPHWDSLILEADAQD